MRHSLSCLFLVFTSLLFGQIKDSLLFIPDFSSAFKWQQLDSGLFWCEQPATTLSNVGNSTITIIRIDTKNFDFEMCNASAMQNKKLTVEQWADTFNYNIVFNAGMYSLKDGLTHRGYSRFNEHFNNPQFQDGYNSMIVFNPKDSSKQVFDIKDLKCNSWEHLKHNYYGYAQGMRMIDCAGEPLSWSKRNQSCSMLVAGMDNANQLYLLFCRSPYTHDQMIRFLLEFPFRLHDVIYLEGGPETSLFVRANGSVIRRVGSYVSDTYPTDENSNFWPLPNIIGLRRKN